MEGKAHSWRDVSEAIWDPSAPGKVLANPKWDEQTLPIVLGSNYRIMGPNERSLSTMGLMCIISHKYMVIHILNNTEYFF